MFRLFKKKKKSVLSPAPKKENAGSFARLPDEIIFEVQKYLCASQTHLFASTCKYLKKFSDKLTLLVCFDIFDDFVENHRWSHHLMSNTPLKAEQKRIILYSGLSLENEYSQLEMTIINLTSCLGKGICNPKAAGALYTNGKAARNHLKNWITKHATKHNKIMSCIIEVNIPKKAKHISDYGVYVRDYCLQIPDIVSVEIHYVNKTLFDPPLLLLNPFARIPKNEWGKFKKRGVKIRDEFEDQSHKNHCVIS